MNNKKNQFVVPGAKQAIEKMKYEIASELGGEITKRLVSIAEQHLGGSNYQSK